MFISFKSDGNMKLPDKGGDKTVLENRRKFLQKLGKAPENGVFAGLVHGNNVEIVDSGQKGQTIPKTDGLITQDPEIFLAVTVADCLPVYIFDENEKGAGILHAGWRGIVAGIIENGIEKFQENLEAKTEEIHIKIGPAIGPCCFEVNEEIAQKFEKYPGAVKTESNQFHVDLKLAAKQIATQNGIPEKNIEISPECTACLPEKYFSYRRDKPEEIEAMMAGVARDT